MFISVLTVLTYGQVAPDYKPYSIEYSNTIFNEDTISIKNISGSFMEQSLITIQPNYSIYRLVVDLDSVQTGYVFIDNWNIPDNAMLFIFNNAGSYTGPYLKNATKSFFSGRFHSKQLIFEYVVPIHSGFMGDFNIAKIYSDYSIKIPINSYSNVITSLSNRERPKVMVTGYWPPTNEMVRHFSQNIDLNPNGWEGENWENLGYDVVSFFPEFDPPNCANCGQGYGDLEVDYQDFSNDFWPIVEDVKPVAIITFSRGFNDHSWELENRLVNRTNWHDDYTEPFLPTPNPPDATVDTYHVRYTSLPIDDIISSVFDAHLGLDAYLDNTNAGMYLSEFAGYHGVWYKETYQFSNEIPCFSAGHIHVGGQIDWDTAREAAEISIRTLIHYIDQFIVMDGDCNIDGEVNILDVVALAGAILGNNELSDVGIEAADIDNNNELNILDIIAIVNIILSE
tara:strand:+ start:1958 stop:3316 length:1359 start_codon:yes stop_codon:yes gene_type:complete